MLKIEEEKVHREQMSLLSVMPGVLYAIIALVAACLYFSSRPK